MNTPFTLSRTMTAGRFSLCRRGPVTIDAEPGLVIRVLAGCLWLPHDEARCSVGIGAAEHFVVRRAGSLCAHGQRATEVELVWPVRVGVLPRTEDADVALAV
jgi:hypothetical protein